MDLLLRAARSRRMALAVAGLMLVSCKGEPSAPKGDPLVGNVVARFAPPTGNPSLHIKSSPSDQCGVVFTINSKTELRRRVNNATRSAELNDFTVGAAVKAWAPYYLESCPAQATATRIELQ